MKYRLIFVSVAAAMAACAVAANAAAPDYAAIEKKVIATIAKELGVKADEIKSTQTLKDLGADDLDVVGIVMALEDAMKIRIPDEALEPKGKEKSPLDLTVGQLCKIVAAIEETSVKDKKKTAPAGDKK